MKRSEFESRLAENGIALYGQYSDFEDRASFHHDGTYFESIFVWIAASRGYLPKYTEEDLEDVISWKKHEISERAENETE